MHETETHSAGERERQYARNRDTFLPVSERDGMHETETDLYVIQVWTHCKHDASLEHCGL